MVSVYVHTRDPASQSARAATTDALFSSATWWDTQHDVHQPSRVLLSTSGSRKVGPVLLAAQMGACISSHAKDDKVRSDAIDQEIERDRKRLRRECKILLLGDPLQRYIPSIITNLLSQALVRAVNRRLSR